MIYDCIIIGGGIAGLQAAIQLGRYQHKILVIDSHNGRSNLCRAYHNILGWANGVSGEYLRTTGRSQAEDLGVEFINQTVVTIEQENHAFVCTVKDEKNILEIVFYLRRELWIAFRTSQKFTLVLV